jgi:hypothetical protein
MKVLVDLVTVNMPTTEVHLIAKTYTSLAALLEVVNKDHPGWTSLVVTVLPARA